MELSALQCFGQDSEWNGVNTYSDARLSIISELHEFLFRITVTRITKNK